MRTLFDLCVFKDATERNSPPDSGGEFWKRHEALVLLLSFLGVSFLLFSFFLCRLFFRDGFFALVARGSRSLGRFDQLFGCFSVRPRGLHREKLFQNRNRIGNCIGLAKVRNSELIVSLSHLRVVLDGFLESFGGFLRPSAICQNRAKIVIALARARRIQLSGLLQSLRGV